MATLSIPVPDDEPFVDMTCNLDGSNYVLQLRCNQRENRFSLSLYLPDGTSLAKGCMLVCDWVLFQSVVNRHMPPGRFVVQANGNDHSPPKLGELGPGKRCELLYIEAGT